VITAFYCFWSDSAIFISLFLSIFFVPINPSSVEYRNRLSATFTIESNKPFLFTDPTTGSFAASCVHQFHEDSVEAKLPTPSSNSKNKSFTASSKIVPFGEYARAGPVLVSVHEGPCI